MWSDQWVSCNHSITLQLMIIFHLSFSHQRIKVRTNFHQTLKSRTQVMIEVCLTRTGKWGKKTSRTTNKWVNCKDSHQVGGDLMDWLYSHWIISLINKQSDVIKFNGQCHFCFSISVACSMLILELLHGPLKPLGSVELLFQLLWKGCYSMDNVKVCGIIILYVVG